MPVSRKLLLLLSASLLAPPIACRSSKGPQQGMSRTMEAPMGRAEPSPMADTSPTPTAAEAIATRARQDLLDSMAIGTNAGGGMVAPNDLQETTVVTWTDPLAAQSGPTNPAEASAPVSSPGTTLIGTDEVSAPSTDITQLTNALAHALHDRSHDGTTPMRDLTVLAALAMLDSERALNTETLGPLTEDERVVLNAMQEWFLAMEAGLDDQEAVLDTMMESLRGLQASLRRSSDFGLSETSLVTRVGGFGDVDEWSLRNEQAQYNFIAHTGQEIILYLELQGFESRLDGGGRWETSTSQQLVIYSDRDGIPVWREQWQTATDHAGSRRNDYFTAQKVTIPTNLSVGKYQLKVRVRDEFSQSESEATIPFVMTAAVLSP